MPVESVEITLIFFIMFVTGMSFVYIFSSLQSNYLKNIHEYIGIVSRNNFFFDYIYAKQVPTSVIKCAPSTTHQTFVLGNYYGVYIQLLNTNVVESLNLTDVSGVGTDVLYIYNDKGIINIVS